MGLILNYDLPISRHDRDFNIGFGVTGLIKLIKTFSTSEIFLCKSNGSQLFK